MALHVIDHPLVQHKLGLLREQGISTKNFAKLSQKLATYSLTKQQKI